MRARVRVVLLATLLVGCAGPFQYNMKRESARVIAPTPHPDSVVISEIRRDPLGTPRKWVATTPSGVYDCSLVEGERHPLCAKR